MANHAEGDDTSTSAATVASGHQSTQREELPANAQSLGVSLAPALIEQCRKEGHGELSNIRWFRADWQRGGAATGHADFQTERRLEHVIIKIPVTARELIWTRRLQSCESNSPGRPNPIIPSLLASGSTLSHYDLAWIIIEELPCGPLGARWQDDNIKRIAEAAGRFYQATEPFPIDSPPLREDWVDLFKGSRQSIRDNSIPLKQRWTKALKGISSKLDAIVDAWRDRPIHTWVHGDLHPANAMCRSDSPDAPVTLIDLAEIRPGHWIEDAIYLERLHWTRPDRLKPFKPVKEIATARKAMGLPVIDGYTKLAQLRRVMLAATAPRFMKTEGSPQHLEACLNRLEAGVSGL